MSRFGRSGQPENRESFSLLVLNVSFRTTADDLFPLFDRYGKVLDIYIPRDHRTGDPRGFAFVRYNYEDEAQDAIDGLDGMRFDGRALMVQFAKYGPNAEKIHRGRITEENPKPRGRCRSRSPRRRRRRRPAAGARRPSRPRRPPSPPRRHRVWRRIRCCHV
uniref:Splicing factor, arginine/serine-rich 2 n=1 Tax=Zea mays TaxID=4577 RepID=B6U9A4_MAIZE|nr:splicing factor, arginine/serine-rich 2 [Zea mays]